MGDTDTDCTCEDYIISLTFVEHLSNTDRPGFYIYFWIIGAILTTGTWILIIPQLRKVWREASEIRDKNDRMMIPFSYLITIFILTFPLFTTTGNMIILLSPLQQLTFGFILSMYLAVILYLYARLLIMYLGNFKAAHQAWTKEAKPTKFYASAPLCFIKCCIKSKHLSSSDFRLLFKMVMQNSIIAPFIQFFNQFPALAVK